jgi:hypothetical protein
VVTLFFVSYLGHVSIQPRYISLKYFEMAAVRLYIEKKHAVALPLQKPRLARISGT